MRFATWRATEQAEVEVSIANIEVIIYPFTNQYFASIGHNYIDGSIP